ncbi:predicted protein, partial [Nematostella vectensis]
WVGSLALSLIMFFSPTAAKLSARLGPRPVSVIGALIAALGLFSTSQVNSIELMYLTYSVLFGTGASCVLIAGVDVSFLSQISVV